MIEAPAKRRRILTGRVLGDRMDKTITVLVERRLRHPLYGKFVRRSSKILAHDESNQARTGDWVEIEECRPLSRRKAWRLARITTGGTGVPGAA